MPDPAKPNRGVIYVFLIFLCTFWLTNSGFDTSEAVYHYRVAKHFVATGQIGFDHPVEGIFTTAPDGRTYASHEFGNTLLLIPTALANHALQAVLGRVGVGADRLERVEQCLTSFQAGLYCALILTFLHRILTREYGQSSRAALLSCAALGFGTYFWNYSRILFDGVLCGLLLTAALWALLRYRRTGSLRDVGIAFALLGLSVDTRLSMVVPTLAFAGALLVIRPETRWKATAAAIVALAPFAAWQLWYNHLRTGHYLQSPVQTAQYAANNALDGDLVTGLVGLLVSPGKGVFLYVPLLVVSVIAFPRFWRRDRVIAGLVLVTGVLWLVLHAKLRSWYGAWGWGPRHLITVVPLLCLPALVHLPELWTRRWGRAVISATVLAGFVLAASAIVGNDHYRMELAYREDRLSDKVFIWGWRSQPVDMLMGAARNLGVVAGVVPPLSVPEASELNNYASNRINICWLTLPHAGVPWPAAAVAVIALVVTLFWALYRLLKSPEARQEKEMSERTVSP